MKIQIDKHTIERVRERGTDTDEIKDVIENGTAVPAKYNKLGKAKVYPFNKERNGKYYNHKRVEVFYLIADDIIITITVYVFYGTWE